MNDRYADAAKRLFVAKVCLSAARACLALLLALAFCLAACGSNVDPGNRAGTQAGGQIEKPVLIYGSRDYARINPAMDEHGEINILLFNGLTAHDGNNQIVPALAESWAYDAASCSYTFYLRQNVKWHDGAGFDAEDVKFTMEAVRNPDNHSENAPNFEDVQEITIIDAYTVKFQLSAGNAAFLDYMSISILPEHLLKGEDMQTSDFFRNPVGTGPYKLKSWEEGQAITLVKNEAYFNGAADIDTIVFKIIADDNARALQMQSGELDLALLTPKDAENFANNSAYTVYRMQTSDYRGIMFNFQNKYWDANRDMIPAVCYALDREAIVKAVLLGHGIPAYGPLQRNIYNNEHVEQYRYNPKKAQQILEENGWAKRSDGFYYRNGEKAGFVLSVGAGDQVRLDIAQAAAQQLKETGIDCTVEITVQPDWAGQMAYLIGWGSPFDADDHTYKVFGTGKAANYSGYSNPDADRYLLMARASYRSKARAEAYAKFQEALAKDPPYAFICYVDADYAASSALKGIHGQTVMGHHGVGIFWNVTEWTLQKAVSDRK